jgi:hypothetical protein
MHQIPPHITLKALGGAIYIYGKAHTISGQIAYVARRYGLVGPVANQSPNLGRGSWTNQKPDNDSQAIVHRQFGITPGDNQKPD